MFVHSSSTHEIISSALEGDAIPDRMARLFPSKSKSFTAINFIRPQGMSKASFHHKPLMDMTMYYSTGYRKPAHLMAYLGCSFFPAKKAEITIYQGVNKQTIPKNPLFITPVAGWLLCNQVPVGRALILHPCQGFIYSFLKKIQLPGNLPEIPIPSKNKGVVSLDPRSSLSCTSDGIVPCSVDWPPEFPKLSGYFPTASDSQRPAIPKIENIKSWYKVPDIPSRQFGEVHGMGHGRYEAVLQVQHFLHSESLASFPFAYSIFIVFPIYRLLSAQTVLQQRGS